MFFFFFTSVGAPRLLLLLLLRNRTGLDLRALELHDRLLFLSCVFDSVPTSYLSFISCGTEPALIFVFLSFTVPPLFVFLLRLRLTCSDLVPAVAYFFSSSFATAPALIFVPILSFMIASSFQSSRCASRRSARPNQEQRPCRAR